MLYDNGVLINSTRDEFKEIMEIYNFYSLDNTIAIITIHPTFDCNFKCTYCIQKDSLNKTEVKIPSILFDKAIIAFFEKYLLENDFKKVKIIWSGGEPLLIWERIKALTVLMANYCQKKGIQHSFGMVSNGSLISKSVAQELLQYHISDIEITVDGPPDVHNRRRISKDGENSFERVINGILNAGQFINVTIRINIDRENIAYYDDFLKYLSHRIKNLRNVSINIERVVKDNRKSNMDYTSYAIEEFSALELDLKNNHSITKTESTLLCKNLMLRCSAHNIFTLNIDSYLNIYKCPVQIGNSVNSIGKIQENGSIYFWGKENVFNCNFRGMSDYCFYCEVLPLCMGHCTIGVQNDESKLKYNNEACITSKFNLHSRIQSLIDNLERAENPLKE